MAGQLNPIGWGLSNQLTPEQLIDNAKNRPTNLTNIANTWGQFIPTFWGNVRLAGYQVWSSPFYNEVTVKEKLAYYNSGSTSDGGTVFQPQYGQYVSRDIFTTVAVDAAFSFGYNGLGTELKITRITTDDTDVYDRIGNKALSDFGFTIRYGFEDYPEPIMVKHEQEGRPTVLYPGQLVVTFEGLKGPLGSFNTSPIPDSIAVTIVSGYQSGIVGIRTEIESDNAFISSADTYHPDYDKKCWYRFRTTASDRGVIEKWDMETYELLQSIEPQVTVTPTWASQDIRLVYLNKLKLFLGQHTGPEDERGRSTIWLINPDTGAEVAKFGTTGYTFDTPPAEGIPACSTLIKASDTATNAIVYGILNGNPSACYKININYNAEGAEYSIFAGRLQTDAPGRIPEATASGNNGVCYARFGQKIYKLSGEVITELLNIPISGEDGIDTIAQPLSAMSTVETDLVFMHGFRVWRYAPTGDQVYRYNFADPLEGMPGAGTSFFNLGANVQALKARRDLGSTVAGSWGNELAYQLDFENELISFVSVTMSQKTVKGSGFFWDAEVGKMRDIARGSNTSNAVIQLPFTEYGGRILLRDFLRSLYVNTGKYTDDKVTFVDIDDTITGALAVKAYELDVVVSNVCQLYQIQKLEGIDYVKFYRNRVLIGESEITYDIDIDELALVEESGDSKPSLITRIADPEKLVAEIELRFIDPEADYNENSVVWRRPDASADATNRLSISTIIIMTKSEALLLLQNKYTDVVSSNTEHELLLPISYSDVYKGDVLRVKHDGFVDVMQVDETSLNANHTVRCICPSIVMDRGSIIDIPDTSNVEVGVSLGKGATELLVFDVPSLHYTHNTENEFAYYYSGYGTDPDWKGGYVTRKSAIEREGRLYETFPDVGFAIYKVSNALSDKRWVIDNDTLELELLSGKWPDTKNGSIHEILADCTRNICLYGKPGRWEVMQVAGIDPLAPAGQYEASGFIRGCRGSEAYCGQHEPDDLIYVIDIFIVMDMRPISNIGVQDSLKAVSFWEKFADKAYVTNTPTGMSIMPWAPSAIQAEYTEEGDILLTWVRRDRTAPPMIAGSAPMFEDDEIYEIDILNGTEVVRTIKGLTSPQYSYSVEYQESDNFDGTLQVKIYQISASVGRGYPGEATLNV